MKEKNSAFICCLFIIFCLSAGAYPLYAQSAAEEIEILLGTQAVTYGQAARFVLEAAGELKTNNPQEAFDFAVREKYLPVNTAAGETARLDRISKLLMRSFKLKGGLFYTITKNPHYAYRELVYINVIQGRADPAMKVTGEKLLFYTGRLLSRREAADAGKEQPVLNADEDAAREAAEHREALAAEITAVLEEQQVADTTVEATDEGVVITLSDIQFLADSVEMPESEREKLRGIARVLSSIQGIKLQVAGHTALAGTAAGRLRISQERAQAVADYLVFLGACRAQDIRAVGYGSDRPIADNSTPEGMAANRRVEITILED